jgi:hypothetical protein
MTRNQPKSPGIKRIRFLGGLPEIPTVEEALVVHSYKTQQAAVAAKK